MYLIWNVKEPGNGRLWLFHIQGAVRREECFDLPRPCYLLQCHQTLYLTVEMFLLYPLTYNHYPSLQYLLIRSAFQCSQICLTSGIYNIWEDLDYISLKEGGRIVGGTITQTRSTITKPPGRNPGRTFPALK